MQILIMILNAVEINVQTHFLNLKWMQLKMREYTQNLVESRKKTNPTATYLWHQEIIRYSHRIDLIFKRKTRVRTPLEKKVH